MDSKPLELMQTIIARLAGNSFQMKTWNVGLATAAIGFVAAKDGRPATAAVYSLAPAMAFWCLDAYYLALEFRFRELYKSACKQAEPSYCLEITPVDSRLMFLSLLRPAVSFLHVPILAVIWWVTKK